MTVNNLFYQELHEKVFVIFVTPIRTSFKFQRKNLKKELMAHMTKKFGLVFNQKLVETMAGKYIKSMRDNYYTNLTRYPNYERSRLIPIEEWDALVKDTNEKKMKKELGSLLASIGKTERWI